MKLRVKKTLLSFEWFKKIINDNYVATYLKTVGQNGIITMQYH